MFQEKYKSCLKSPNLSYRQRRKINQTKIKLKEKNKRTNQVKNERKNEIKSMISTPDSLEKIMMLTIFS